MSPVIIITSAFAAILSFISAFILFKNNTRVYIKSFLGLTFLFFLMKILDLGNMFLNPSSFYLNFGIFYNDFHMMSLIILISFFPILLAITVVDTTALISKKNNKHILFSLSFLFTSITYFLYFSDSFFFKTSYIIHCIVISIIGIKIIFNKRQEFEDFYLFKFLLFIFINTISFMFFSLYFLFSINELLSENNYVLKTMSEFSGPGFHKLILNICIISFSLYILLTKRILHGKYYYESEEKNLINFKNHWNNIIIKKVDKKHLKLYDSLQSNISKLVLDLNHLERKYINNQVLFSSMEEISQLINQRVIDVEFVFRYNNYLTFKKYMLKINMLKAAELIKKGFLKSNSVTDLSKLFGYSSRSAFFTKFKEINGYSPSKYM